MAYIEKLLQEIELSLEDKQLAYSAIEIDLTKEQIEDVKKQLKKLRALLIEAKDDFDLVAEPVKLSRIIDTNTGFVWKTIEEAKSSEVEKRFGQISSDDKKKNIDELLTKIFEETKKIRKTALNKKS